MFWTEVQISFVISRFFLFCLKILNGESLLCDTPGKLSPRERINFSPIGDKLNSMAHIWRVVGSIPGGSKNREQLHCEDYSKGVLKKAKASINIVIT